MANKLPSRSIGGADMTVQQAHKINKTNSAGNKSGGFGSKKSTKAPKSFMGGGKRGK